jgi:hypothetical protein
MRTQTAKKDYILWIIVPLTFCPCAPESADSILASDWRSQMLEQSVMSRSKHLRAKSWQRAWKTKPWMKRLYGRIYDPSTASHGVALWIASLADIPASHSPLPANKKVQKIQDTCGQTSQPSSKMSNQEFAFLKMSPDISNWGSNKSMMTYPQWVTKLRQACLQRRKSVALTNANGFSLWRTVKATESAGGCLSYKTFVERMNAGMPLSLRDQVTHLWPTVRVSSANGPAQSEIDKGNPKGRLEVSVVNWLTPTVQDYKKRGPNSSQQGLAETSVNWATPNTMDHLPPRSQEAMERLMGPNGQRAGRSRPSNLREQIMWPTVTAQDSKNNAGPSQFVRNTKPLNVEAVCHSRRDRQENGTESRPVLNPQFVEWLMGWPIGWTEFEPVETVSSHWLPLMRGMFLQLLEMENKHS